MKLKVKIGDLLDAVSQVSTTLDRKGSVSGRMYFKASNVDNKQFLYLYATNLVAETLTKIPAEVEEGGAVLIDPSRLQDGLNGIGRDQDVSLVLTPNKATLKAQAGKTKFSMAVGSEVNEISNKIKALPLTEAVTLKIPAASLSEFVKRGVFCIASDDTGQNPGLTGLRISGGPKNAEARATDNAIAVSIKVAGKAEGLSKGILVPYQSLLPLSTLVNRKRGEDAEVILAQAGNKVLFKFGDTVYSTLLLATAFPNLGPIMDNVKSTYNFEVNREDFKATLARASSFIGATRVLELELQPAKDNELLVRAKGDGSNGDYTDSVEVEFIGDGPVEATKMSVGIDYLVNVAGSTRSNSLSIGMTDKLKPLIITDSEGEGDKKVDTKYVLMGVM